MMKNDINVKGSGEMRRWGKERGWRSSGEMKRYRREKCWRSVNVKFKKKYIKKIIRKWKEKKIMTWMLTWLNVSAAALNATFQLLVIYRFIFSLPHLNIISSLFIYYLFIFLIFVFIVGGLFFNGSLEALNI